MQSIRHVTPWRPITCLSPLAETDRFLAFTTGEEMRKAGIRLTVGKARLRQLRGPH
ncbi:hypothetical protein X743_32165 [Mesorhizobium sp. LNHC252B00]|nr:hypothetical protein X743_32165 [Mesorhizobium sp. LNHC252B00]